MTSEKPEAEAPEAETPAMEAAETEVTETEAAESEQPETEAVGLPQDEDGASDDDTGEDDSGEDDSGGDDSEEEEDASEARAEAADDDVDPADFDNLRLVEALLFASAEPLAPAQLARFLPDDVKLEPLLADLQTLYANRGVNLVKRGGRWAFRTAEDLAPRMELENQVVRKLSRVALETLAVIAYHQPVTRAEIEEVRGVALSKGTLDALLEIGWIRPKGRRKTPGRPVTWGTSDAFLDHFGLEGLDALPGVEELKAAGLLDTRPALTALSDRGLLPAAGDVAPEEADEEDDEDESEIIEGSEAELLDATFGEDMLPQEVETSTASSGDGDDADAEGEGGGDDLEDEVLDSAAADPAAEPSHAGGSADADFEDDLPELAEEEAARDETLEEASEAEAEEEPEDESEDTEPRRNTG